MLGPYQTKDNGTISYKGNKVFGPIDDVQVVTYPTSEIEKRVLQFKGCPMWGHVARINHRINLSANAYFDEMSALFTALPLTTRMISSPGAVYGKEKINYSSDTCPITLNWFDLPRTAFLSESSQIYLELALMQDGVDHVYSIYNSFRKEAADYTHLSEFHHIEYEGKVDQNDNNRIMLGLVARILQDLLAKNEEALVYFLPHRQLKNLEHMANHIQNTPSITFSQTLEALYQETADEKYKHFTMDGTFGPWEEVRLTEMFGSMVAVNQFPLLEVPFYHAVVDGTFPDVADNTDFIWPGYRETIGSGHRVRSIAELEAKADIFDLPREDYEPYLQTRELPGYAETSGFGLGWERLLHGLLEMPFIWSASQFPRGHTTLKP